MIAATTFRAKAVAVFGLGSSGAATAKALAVGGAEVAAWDDTPAAREVAARAGVPLVDLSTADWRRFAVLVLAPGVPLTHPQPHWTVNMAHAAGVEVIGDIELFFRERAAHCPDAPVVAVTGTNGKSTTTALIAHVLTSAGRDAQMGGNIGVPILALAPPARDRIHVIEMSSFQIDLTPGLRPTVGVLLNLSPDHLDRHGTFADYAAIKERLIAGAGFAVIGSDDAWCRSIAERSARAGQAVARIATRKTADVSVSGSRLLEQSANGVRAVADLGGIGALRGEHNGQNAAAAFAAARWLGVSASEIVAGLRTFPGLPHRMEEVGRLGKVLFINDSKATNADSTGKALASFERGIFWILGGRPKEGGIASLAPFFPRVAKAYLIGQATEQFAAMLEHKVPFERCGTLDRALAAAARDAAESPVAEPVVLLSPACASHDQFKSFEQRGDLFRELAARLPGVGVKPRPAP
jgi:UDP-N-acetylmuramoylalanine--D-glutamate ligase